MATKNPLPAIKIDTSRLEFFSDAVMAVIITISVLSFKTPDSASLSSLTPLIPLFIVNIISFQTIGTYWNNHHHLMVVTKTVNIWVMWSNLYLLFWLSFIPFSAEWLGRNHNAPAPTLLFAFVLLMAAIAYNLLVLAITENEGKRSLVARIVGDDRKGKISVALNVLAVAFAYFIPWLADVFIIGVALFWFYPDRRIEDGG